MTDKIDALFIAEFGPEPQERELRHEWYISRIAFRAGYTAHAKSLDPSEMREMLRAMQHGEMTVSRGVELLDMWLAGNYNDEQLPPIRDELDEGEMPWDRIDKLTAALAARDGEVEMLREALTELADLMEDVCTGDYKPDSFTSQPARAALAATAKEK